MQVICEGFELRADVERTVVCPGSTAVGSSLSNAKNIASQHRLRHNSYRLRHRLYVGPGPEVHNIW